MTSPFDAAGALEAVDRIVNRGGDPDDVIAAVLRALERRGVPYAAVEPGPEVGTARDAIVRPVVRGGAEVAVLRVAVDEEAFVERVAALISPYVSR